MTSGLHADFVLQRGSLRLEVDLDLAPGRVTAVVGPNGAGKTSLVRAITGLESIESGSIEIASRVVDAGPDGEFVEAHDRNIGAVFQDTLLFPHLNVRDNVTFGVGKHSDAESWLSRVGLDGLGKRRPAELSGGQAKRVAIARALIRQPDLVVLDEPFAGVDAAARASLQRLLTELIGADERAAWLLVTHDPTHVDALADEVVVLEQGRVTQRGTPDELRRFPATGFVAEFVGQNLLRGTARAGTVTIDQGLELAITDTSLSGAVAVTISPSAVAVHRTQPAGSPRNAWEATVGAVHPLGEYCRVAFNAPVPLVVDVTPAAVTDLDIAAGRSLWVAVKATSLECRPLET